MTKRSYTEAVVRGLRLAENGEKYCLQCAHHRDSRIMALITKLRSLLHTLGF